MSNLKFTDGESFDTSGNPRIEKRYDGLYVLGLGNMIPVRDDTEAEQQVQNLRRRQTNEIFGTDDYLADRILQRAFVGGYITLVDANDCNNQSMAEEVARSHADDEEIGSSDFTFILGEFLSDIGKKVDYSTGRLKVIG